LADTSAVGSPVRGVLGLDSWVTPPTGRSRPWPRIRRRGGRGVRASLLRHPASTTGSAVPTTRRTAVDPRDQRSHRPRGSRAPGADDAAGSPVQTRGTTLPPPGPGRDAGSGPRTGTLPRRPP